MRVCTSDANTADRNAQTISRHLCHFGIQALAHFSATVVDADRAIHVNVQERSTLVQHGGGEADAEFQWHQGQTFFAVLIGFIELIDFNFALAVVGLCFHLRHHFVTHPVFNLLTVLGG